MIVLREGKKGFEKIRKYLESLEMNKNSRHIITSNFIPSIFGNNIVKEFFKYCFEILVDLNLFSD